MAKYDYGRFLSYLHYYHSHKDFFLTIKLQINRIIGGYFGNKVVS